MNGPTVECIRCWERFSADANRSQGWLCPKCSRFTQRALDEDRIGGEQGAQASALAGPVTSDAAPKGAH